MAFCKCTAPNKLQKWDNFAKRLCIVSWVLNLAKWCLIFELEAKFYFMSNMNLARVKSTWAVLCKIWSLKASVSCFNFLENFLRLLLTSGNILLRFLIPIMLYFSILLLSVFCDVSLPYLLHIFFRDTAFPDAST